MNVLVTLAVLACIAVTSLLADFQHDCTHAHNQLRNLHQNTAPLQWDANIAADATRHAEQMLARDVFEHSDDLMGLNRGENMMKLTGHDLLGYCTTAALSWYSEIVNYNFVTGTSSNGKPIGHFTQLVWQSSTHFGVGYAYDPQTKVGYVVAQYHPSGNRAGQYVENVRPRKPGAVTPTIYQLNEALCNDDAMCNAYLSFYDCFYPGLDKRCPVSCNLCIR